jgi:hypothetical protein
MNMLDGFRSFFRTLASALSPLRANTGGIHRSSMPTPSLLIPGVDSSRPSGLVSSSSMPDGRFICSLSPDATLPRDWGFKAGSAFAALAPVDYGDAPPDFCSSRRSGAFAGSNSFFKQLRESRDSVRACPSLFDSSIVVTLMGARTEIAPPKSRVLKE